MVRGMTDAIRHRGPDEEGYYQSPAVSLGSRRLSIVGLQDGCQPLSNEDRSIFVVFNGELFDYPEVKEQLSARGHRFRTHCDTELLPHLWEDHGEGMLERLRGQFALALWDSRRRQLVLARDRFGICPLYWTRQTWEGDEWLLFASEIKGLLASGKVPAHPDPRGINHAFTFFALPGPVTCFAGVQLLLPGRYLSIQLDRATAPAHVQERIYWEIDFPERGQEDPGNDPQRLIEEFEAILQRAVAKRLRADVPVVSYLSGGVDSSTVVALANRLRKSEGKDAIPTFTISIQDPHLNEEAAAAQTARYVDARPVVVNCGRADVLQTYPALIRAAEGPVIDTACAALLMLAQEVHAQGYKVALTGEGADEWLAGYPWYKAQKLLNGLDALPGLRLSYLLRRLYLRFSGAPRVPWSWVMQQEELVGGPNAWLNLYGMLGLSKLRFYSAWLKEELDGHMPLADLQLNVERARRWHPLNRSLYLGARVMLPGLLLSSKGDRVAMNSSVETRYPFLDEDLFAFLARLHPRWKLRGFREKYLLRLLAERWLPSEIAWRRKGMFRAPFDSFFTADEENRGPAPTFVDQLLSTQSLRKTGYFDPQGVQMWRRRAAGMSAWSLQRPIVEMGLVGVVATQLWHHTFIDGSLADLPSWQASAISDQRSAISDQRRGEELALPVL
jgi:asparagine synthase (glutamine-hydrolysing)